MSVPRDNRLLIDPAILPTAEEALAEYDKQHALDIMSGKRENPNHDERGRFASGSGGDVRPPKPGEAPLPDGMVRVYHYTGTKEQLDSIREHGLLQARAIGETYGEPNVVWASFEKPPDERHYVEVAVRPDEVDLGGPSSGTNYGPGGWAAHAERVGANITLKGDVPADRILTYNEPWMSHYDYIKADAGVDAVKRGELDYAISISPDYAKAIEVITNEKDFREDEHPRDDHGKFTSAGGGDVATADLPAAVRQPGAAAMKNVDAWVTKQGWDAKTFEDNTRAVFDAATPEQRETGMHWYERAHEEARALADAHGLTIEQGAGVIASMSPNREWEGNVADARLVTELVTAPQFTLDAATLDARYATAMKYADDLKGEARAKALVKADTIDAQLRPWIGTHDTKEIPTEVLARFAHVQQYPDNVEKAIGILRGADPKDLLWSFEQQGPRGGTKVTVPTDSGLKVRSFYANILSPHTSREVTVDTHIMRAVTGDLSIRPADSGVVSGNSARYTVFRDPIYKIADEEGLLPHQVQAIIWTQINEGTTRRDVGQWFARTKDYTLDDGTAIADEDFILAMIFHGYSAGAARDMLDAQASGMKSLDDLFDPDLWVQLRAAIMPSVVRMFHKAFMDGAHLATQQRRGRKDNPNHDERGRFASGGGGSAEIDRVVERYGTTDNWREAGYILPDGRMVQMHRDVLGAQRVEHDKVAQHGLDATLPKGPLNIEDATRGVTSNINVFMERTGAVRIDGNVNMDGYPEQGSAGVELPARGVTDAQMQVLDRVLAQKHAGPGTPKAVFDIKVSGGYRTANINTRAQLRRFIAGEDVNSNDSVSAYRSIEDALDIMRGERAGPAPRPPLPLDIEKVERAAQDLIANYSDAWWRQFTTSTQDRMRKTIALAEANGLTTDDVIAEFEPLFGTDRAEAIATTETARLLGMGAVATFEAAGLEAWRWNSVEDTLVDPICAELQRRADENGEAFSVDDPFNIVHPFDRCWPSPASPDAIVTGTLADAITEITASV